MVFSSLLFIFCFLPVVLFLYFVLKKELRNGFLLAASLFFYAWGEPRLFVIMLLVTIIAYICGLLMHSVSGKARQAVLGLTVALCLVILVYYKYMNFLIDLLYKLVPFLHSGVTSHNSIILPVGISFYTFHAISYLVDIYREKSEPQKNLLLLGLYISFFPQLVAGPIVRYHDIADQLGDRKIDVDDMAYGINRFALGLGKKVLIANPLASVADQLFAVDPSGLPTATAWLGIVCYTLQIYYDFSGYSDMAIGLARMFGFRFPENFNYPYIAQSMQQFWRRWHISLSNWFRDYVYIPLGGNRVKPAAVYRNLIIVFGLTGIWHGASWTFVVWGFFHGAFLLLERTRFGVFLGRLWRPLQHVYVLMVVILGWVLFRAEDMSYAIAYMKAMFTLNGSEGSPYYFMQYWNHEISLVLTLAILGAMPLSYLLQRFASRLQSWGQPFGRLYGLLASFVRVAYMALIMLLSFLSLASSTYNPFIYFRF